MNARESIHTAIERGKRRVDGSSDFSENELKTLRAIDALLADFVNDAEKQASKGRDIPIALLERARLLGYGDAAGEDKQ